MRVNITVMISHYSDKITIRIAPISQPWRPNLVDTSRQRIFSFHFIAAISKINDNHERDVPKLHEKHVRKTKA